MKKRSKRSRWVLKDIAITLLFFLLAVAVCLMLSQTFSNDNAFATAIFLLAVALISRFTTGYAYGIAASLASVLCVNYMFTHPYWAFDLTLEGYPLTFSVMLFVSLIISALTTRLKQQESLKLEAEMEKMRANLLRSISHDIRTPLTSILGASSTILENGNLSLEDRKDLASEIQEDAQWLIRIVENILSITRFNSSEVALRKKEEVAEEVISSAIVKFRKNFKDVELSVSYPEEILLIPMDAVLIEQVFLNLLENAVRHGGKTTRIWLKVENKDGLAFFYVIDNGNGLSERTIAHLFSGSLEVADDRSTGNKRDMGIGLTVCLTIVRAHGGTMAAWNNEYGGATFRFTLPATQ